MHDRLLWKIVTGAADLKSQRDYRTNSFFKTYKHDSDFVEYLYF